MDVKHPKAKKEYTYLIKEEQASTLRIGDSVRVPFNNANVSGVITEISTLSEVKGLKLKQIIKKEGISLPVDLVNLSKDLSKYYGTPVIDFLKLMLPPKVSTKKELVYYACSYNNVFSARAYNQKQVFEFVLENGTVSVNEISNRIKIPTSSIRSALNALLKKGLIKKDYRTIRREPTVINQNNYEKIILTKEQKSAVASITDNFNKKRKTTLVYGVTGSGKTEVYIRVIKNVIKDGKKAILLVPEISLTPQILSIFQQRFPEQTAVIHSRLSPGERFDEWQRIFKGEASVVIGARSAIFAPIKDLGIIIIDEEHETSYKNGEHPYYDARIVAKFRANNQNAMLVLGSATPSVESFYKVTTGEYSLVKLTKRVSGRPLPKLEIIDMKEELKAGNRNIFSRKLLSGIKAALDNKKQVILFLNRRGHSTFIICRDCGFVLKCVYCDISLTYHFEDRTSRCHYCGYSIVAPDICPKCKSQNIRYFGAGTQKVEQQIKRFFPKSNTLRIDSDTTSKKGSMEKMLLSFRKGSAQILIGTQAVAKGLDFPNVALVGIISADTALNMPDFRSGERTFQLITQVAGRAGRGDTPGLVYVQTYTPESFAIKCACRQNLSDFYKEELRARYRAFYPPFCNMLNIILKGHSEDLVKQQADDLKRILFENYSDDVQIYGPVPAPRGRIKENYRYNLLLKSNNLNTLIDIAGNMQTLNKNKHVALTWDMGPQDLL